MIYYLPQHRFVGSPVVPAGHEQTGFPPWIEQVAPAPHDELWHEALYLKIVFKNISSVKIVTVYAHLFILSN